MEIYLVNFRLRDDRPTIPVKADKKPRLSTTPPTAPASQG
jgi:hypothetical protein